MAVSWWIVAFCAVYEMDEPTEDNTECDKCYTMFAGHFGSCFAVQWSWIAQMGIICHDKSLT